MQTRRRVEDGDLKIEELVSTNVSNAGDGGSLDDLLKRVEEQHAGDETDTVDAAGDGAAAASAPVDAAAGKGNEQATTVEEVLEKVDRASAGKLEDTIKADEARLKASSHKLVASKVRKSSKQYSGYVAFCVGAIVLGAVWLAVGLLTGSVWPIPLFGVWNEVCGAFLIMWGGLMLLDAR